MRQARFVPLRRRRLLGVMTACALAFAGWGCQQPPCFYYYGYGVPPCPPVVPAPSAAQSSAVGDVPTPIIEGGTATADGSGRTTVVHGSQKFPRIVVSEPANPPRLSWQRTDPDASLATTSVQGAVSDSSVDR
jgi:hypothetical protein